MRRIAGFVFDTYDDVDGRVLRSVVPDIQHLPSFVKTASRLTQDQIERLSDDRFALVMLNEGAKFKKYACVDEGNTALSVMYLLKQAHLLPPEAVKIAASNLVGACEQFGLDVPPQLKIAAKSGVSPVSGKSERPYAKNAKVSRIQFPVTEVPKVTTMNPHLGQHDAGLDDIKDRVNADGVAGNNMVQVPIFPMKEKEKQAFSVTTRGHQLDAERYKAHSKAHYDSAKARESYTQDNPLGSHVSGHAVAGIGDRLHARHLDYAAKKHEEGKNAWNPFGGMLTKSRHEAKEKRAAEAVTKQKSWRQLPYVDVSGWDPSSAEGSIERMPEMTLLGGHYPVDGYDQIKTAAEYFSIDGKDFHPRQKHEYCIKLASRMSDVGMEIPEDIERYGSTTYAADVDSYVTARRPYVHEEFHPALDLLLEKRAQVSPGTFAEALNEFDTISDLRWHWGTKVADPWYSTFGPSLEKVAAANWTFEDGGARIDEEDLKNLAMNGGELLQKSFGPHFLRDFQKNPKTVFNSMPKPNQIVIARMAMDRYSGTGTE